MTRTGKFYRQNEREVMAELGLVGTKGSGAFWLEKEDGQSEFIIAQLKSTDKESMKINLLDIEKLNYNAKVAHKIPIFVIQFLKDNDVFVMSRPQDIPLIAEYLECGKVDIIKNEIDDLVIQENQEVKTPKKKIISSTSKNRSKFWDEKEKERKKIKWQK